MKFVRHGEKGKEKPGVVADDGTIRDLTSFVKDITGYELAHKLDDLRKLDFKNLPIATVERYGACVGNIGKFMCIGLNYSDHAAETGAAIPEHPILFMKATSAVNGPNDMVILPRGSTHTDWEVELGLVIGKTCKYVTADNALDYVAGYFVANDVSERHFQTQLTGTWTKGKSCDTFGPIGPYLVTADEVPDPQNLNLGLKVNGQVMQEGNTSNMIFTVAEIIEHLSSLMTLHPGDVIITGTPPGVGMGIKPTPIYLKEGDKMEVWVEGLGSQTQIVGQDK